MILDAPVAHLRLDDLDLASQCPGHLKTLGLIHMEVSRGVPHFPDDSQWTNHEKPIKMIVNHDLTWIILRQFRATPI